jgi:hypothetical protein
MLRKILFSPFVTVILLLTACDTALPDIPSTGQSTITNSSSSEVTLEAGLNTTPFAATGTLIAPSPAPLDHTATPQHLEQVITQTPPAQQSTPVLPAVILNDSVLFLSQMLNVPSSQVQVLAITYEVWPDTCLGVVSDGVACAEVITPGYRLLLHSGRLEYEMRTNLDGSQILLVEEGKNELPPGPFEPPPSPQPKTEDNASLFEDPI